jgi:kynurenine--oxoglutarate transaminase/cysteine-S-conjugate beta-lyase/glutamine--phenylpyruvate transaminase
MSKLTEWSPDSPNAVSLIEASIADLKDEKDEYRDFRFVKWLAKHRNLLGIPPSIFYSKPHKALGEDFIRLCYYRKAETLQNANSILMDLKLEDKHD